MPSFLIHLMVGPGCTDPGVLINLIHLRLVCTCKGYGGLLINLIALTQVPNTW